MRVVLTGAGGFAGRWLSRRLVLDGSQVFGLVRRVPTDGIDGVSYLEQDILDGEGVAAAMASIQPSVVFHLAAMTHLGRCQASPELAFATNVAATRNVFQAMPRNARGVFASTCHVYGRPVTDPIREDHVLNPSGVYAQSKVEAEAVVASIDRDVVIARAFHHSGPGQSTDFVLADWASQVKSGAREVVVGNLDVERDFSDVRDIVDGYVILAEHAPECSTVNLASGIARPLHELIGLMTRTTGASVRVDPGRVRADDVPVFRGDSRAARDLGWSPRFSIEQTIADLLQSVG